MRIFHPLRSPPTALLWGGMSLSALGDQLYAVALTWIAVTVLGSHSGYLSALSAFVLLLGVLGLGRWADRWEPRRSMVAADLVRAATLALVVVAWLASGGPSAVGLVLAVVVLALGQAVFQPALQAVLPRVVADPALLPAANGLMDTTERSARLLGPGLVGMLAAVVPVVHFLTLDAISFVASAGALVWVGRSRPGPPVRPCAREALWASIRRGVAAMRSHALLSYVLSTTAVVNGTWVAVFYLALPLMIQQRGVVGPGGAGLGAYGLVMSAYGCTNLGATLVFGSRAMPRRPQFQMFGGSALVGLGIVLVGLAGLLPQDLALPGLMAGAALGAMGGPMKDIPVAVLRQTRLRPGDMAAAMRAYMAMSSIGSLAAMMLAPSLIGMLGVLPVILGCGIVLMTLGIFGAWQLRDWREELT